MPAGDAAPRHPWLRRVGWLVLLWAAGVATLGAVAVIVRLLMRAAGLGS